MKPNLTPGNSVDDLVMKAMKPASRQRPPASSPRHWLASNLLHCLRRNADCLKRGAPLAYPDRKELRAILRDLRGLLPRRK